MRVIVALTLGAGAAFAVYALYVFLSSPRTWARMPNVFWRVR